MKKIASGLEPILEMVSIQNKNVLDVGCGIGEVVRWLTGQGAEVTGVDVLDLIKKAEQISKTGNEKYLEGNGEDLPVPESSFEIVLFIASLHHVQSNKMNTALSEAARVLKNDGSLLVLEPLIDCSYYQITRLVEDETELRKQALLVLDSAGELGFETIDEQFFYQERTLSDYRKLLDIYFKGTEQERESVEKQAIDIALNLGPTSENDPDKTIFQSTAFLRHLKMKI